MAKDTKTQELVSQELTLPQAEPEVPQGLQPKFGNLEVRLTDYKGNTIGIQNKIVNAMRRAGLPEVEIKAFILKAMDSPTPGDLIVLCANTVRIC